MTKSNKDDVPFSYPVKVGHISANPVEVHVEADVEERAGLARLWNILEVKSLKATMTVVAVEAGWRSRQGTRLGGDRAGLCRDARSGRGRH